LKLVFTLPGNKNKKVSTFLMAMQQHQNSPLGVKIFVFFFRKGGGQDKEKGREKLGSCTCAPVFRATFF